MKLISLLIVPILLACATSQENSQQDEQDCVKMKPTGSHMTRVECKTKEQRRKEKEEAKEDMLRIQRDATQLGN